MQVAVDWSAASERAMPKEKVYGSQNTVLVGSYGGNKVCNHEVTVIYTPNSDRHTTLVLVAVRGRSPREVDQVLRTPLEVALVGGKYAVPTEAKRVACVLNKPRPCQSSSTFSL